MNTREKIVHTAYQLFVRNGYRGVSVNDIILEAEISKGGFYHHFKGKGELLEAVMEISFYQEFRDLINYFDQKGVSPTSKLKYFFQVLWTAFQEWREKFTREELEVSGYALLEMEATHQFRTRGVYPDSHVRWIIHEILF
jgi:AcrR family transcriptional regulator